MQINVNGQNYDDWESVPAEVRQQLAATLPDADRNGMPDLFETGALPPGAQSFTSISVNGQSYDGVSSLPPEVQERLKEVFGWFQPQPAQAGLATGPAPWPVSGVGTGASGPPLATAVPSGHTPPPPPLEPGQVMLNGVPTSVGEATTEKKSWWRRLFGG